jgi:hypothetical protein
VHLNGDEGMCFGAAFIASNSSSLFKVKKVYLTQHPREEIEIRISPLNEDEADLTSETAEDGEEPVSYNKNVILYKRKDYLGQKKTINVVYDRAMKIDVVALSYNDADEVESEEALVTFEMSELDKIMKEDVMSREGTTKPKVSL